MTQDDAQVQKHMGLMVNLSKSFARSTGLPMEDFMSCAYLGFAEAKNDEEHKKIKESFPTYLVNICKHRMIDYYKATTRLQKDREHFAQCFTSYSQDILQEQIFKDQLNNLSQESKEICKMIFDNPGAYLVQNRPKLSRGKLKEQLLASGWRWHQIWKSFREISEVLTQIN